MRFLLLVFFPVLVLVLVYLFLLQYPLIVFLLSLLNLFFLDFSSPFKHRLNLIFALGFSGSLVLLNFHTLIFQNVFH